MITEEYLKIENEVEKIHKEHNDFYELAEKYGFYAPWSRCEKDS